MSKCEWNNINRCRAIFSRMLSLFISRIKKYQKVVNRVIQLCIWNVKSLFLCLLGVTGNYFKTKYSMHTEILYRGTHEPISEFVYILLVWVFLRGDCECGWWHLKQVAAYLNNKCPFTLVVLPHSPIYWQSWSSGAKTNWTTDANNTQSFRWIHRYAHWERESEGQPICPKFKCKSSVSAAPLRWSSHQYRMKLCDAVYDISMANTHRMRLCKTSRTYTHICCVDWIGSDALWRNVFGDTNKICKEVRCVW